MTALVLDSARAIARSKGLGEAMHALIRDLYPICRSITGNGVRETLRRVSQRVPLEMREVPSGTRVFDWTVPKEWNIRDAYIRDPSGRNVVDFRHSTLHVVSYSIPVNLRMTLGELKRHIHSLPEQPDWIPYKTSYYEERWGFCLTQRQLDQLAECQYQVHIDSTLEPGSLTYGECVVPGTTSEEILVSCHVCHPALCNDNLSGIALCAQLAGMLRGYTLRYTYRFIFIPGTIGAITWLALNEQTLPRIKHGLVVANVGDSGHMHYKKSRRGNAAVDRAAMHVLRHSGARHEVMEFSPYGYDERQFCSPGIDLPMGSLTRTPWGRYPEYHTSADDLTVVQPRFLEDSLATCLLIFSVLENDRRYLNQNPKCEPQLGRRGLYRQMGGNTESKEIELAMLWVLNLSDGQHGLLDIADRAGLRFERVAEAAELLCGKGLLVEVAGGNARMGQGGEAHIGVAGGQSR